MLNLLNYYYQIIIDEVRLLNNKYYFTYNSHSFIFCKYKRSTSEIKALYNLNQSMINSGIKVGRFILNRENDLLTVYNNEYYCLILVDGKENKEIGLIDIINSNNLISSLKEFAPLIRNDWYSLWTSKIDYVEYQLIHLEDKHKIISNSINYYIGLSENAISYMGMYNVRNANLYITRRRITIRDKYLDLNNPLELVIDYKPRDIAEYIKSLFFNGKANITDIFGYLDKIYLTTDELVLFYIRMLFPTYYFDIYDGIINEELDEKELEKIISKQESYEEFLYQLYVYLRKKVNLVGVDWINKKFS